MRFFILVLSIPLLTNCSSVMDRAISGQTAAAKLKADLVGDLTLRGALEQDMARKNAELLYLSSGGYSCGPSDPETAAIPAFSFRKKKDKDLADRAERRLSYAKNTYGDLRVVLAYGEALDKAIKIQADSQKTIDDFQKLVTSVSGLVPREFEPAPKILGAVVRARGVVQSYEARLSLISLARSSVDGLSKARESIKQKGIQKQMTELERKAFSDWDTCAYDRLQFLRAYDPKRPPSYLHGDATRIATRTMGEARSSVLDFSALYNRYLDEKTAFVGQLNDYLADIDAIIDANNKLASLDASKATADDFIVAITGVVSDATTVYSSYQTIEASAR